MTLAARVDAREGRVQRLSFRSINLTRRFCECELSFNERLSDFGPLECSRVSSAACGAGLATRVKGC